MSHIRINRHAAAILGALAAAGSARSVNGQLYRATGYTIVHQFNFGLPSTWTRVEGHWFGHGWARSCNQWLDQNAAWTPWGQSGQPAQLANFAPYGSDKLLAGGTAIRNNGYPSPLSPPFPYNPPGSVNVPVQVGTMTFPPSGTMFWPAGAAMKGVTASNGFVRGDGWSDFQVNGWAPPYAPPGTVDGTIRTYGGYTENSIQLPVERGYGFSYTELDASGIINPQYQPPMFWGMVNLLTINMVIPPPPAGGATFSSGPVGAPWQPPYLAKRVYDPVVYTATDTVTGASITGVAYTMHADAGYDTTVDVQGGVMNITGPDASVRIEMTDPRVSPQGTYELDIRNGMVVVSSATGAFAGQMPPPPGSVTPLSFAIPTSFAFSVDLNGFTNNPIDLNVKVSSAGAEPIPELACAKIGLEPAGVSVCQGASGSLRIGAYGTGTLMYQWRRGDGLGNFWPILDGPTPGGSIVSGAQTDTLTFNGAGGFDGATYDCIVFDVCGVATSQPAVLTVTNCPAACYANCDGSSGSPLLTSNDFQCFLDRYAQGVAYANCDGSAGSPTLTPNDFQCFLNSFALGCH